MLTAAVFAAMLAGCGGGGGGHSAIPSTTSGSTGAGAGQGSGSGVPVTGNSKGTATVIAKANLATAAIPQLYDRKNAASKRSSAARLKAMGATFNNVEVDGTLYQGSAAAVPVTNTQTVPVVSGGVTVSETFSNVVPANNDWVVFEFYAVAADGSKTQLGSLGTFVNVGANTTTTNLGAASTQVLQVAGEMMFNGQISTYDIEQSPSLASTLATQIAGFSPAVDAQTGLYDPATVQTLAMQLAGAYERDITINATGAQEFSIVYDSTKADENDFAYNAGTFAATFGLSPNVSAYVPSPSAEAGTTTVLGAPLTTTYSCCPSASTASTPSIPLHAPSTGLLDAQPSAVYATLFATTSSTITLRNVYGGHIVIGAHNGIAAQNSTLPPSSVNRQSAARTRSPQDITDDSYGATAALAGEAPGASTQTLTLADELVTVQISDPASAAFATTYGQLENEYFQVAASAGPNAAGVIPAYNSDCVGNSCASNGLIDQEVYGNIGMPSSSGVSTLTYDGWNPYNIPASQQELCGFNSCAPITSTTPINVTGTFDDPITNPAVFGWTPSGAATSIVQNPSPPCCNDFDTAYLVTYTIPANNSSSVAVTLSGTVPASFDAEVPAHGQFYFYSPNIYGYPYTIQFTDTNGKTYSDSGSIGNYTPLTDANAPFLVKNFTVTVTIPAADASNPSGSPITKSFNILYFYINGTFSSSGCDC